MSSTDQRSVGELLLQADHTARDILMEVHDLDAATMLRTWGEVVQAAGELWRALPTTAPPQPGTEDRLPDLEDLAMQRLQAMTDSHHRRHRTGWPGQGGADERHLEIASSFARADDLVTRHRTPQPPLTAAERADLNAARTRILHTLYVGSHGVNVAVGRHLRELEANLAVHRRVPAGESLRQVRAAHEHITAFEHLAGSVVAQIYPGALAGEHRDPPAAGRLAQALASWDVVSHRVLAGSTHTADLMLAARTQAVILTGSSVLLRAAAETGHVDQAHRRGHLDRALVTAQARWETLARTWAALTPPADRRNSLDLAAASRETRAALLEILHEGAVTSRTAVIAARTDLSRVPALVGQVLSANVDLAHVTSDAAHDRRLTGAARAVNSMATATHRQSLGSHVTADDSPRAAAATPQDLLANRAVRLPYSVRGQLMETTSALVNDARTAMSAGSHLGTRMPAGQPASEQSPCLGRALHDRCPTRPVVDVPGPRCER